MHVHDRNEDSELPWRFCQHLACGISADSWSASLISRAEPKLFIQSSGITGFIVAPDLEIQCAFPSDVGTLGMAQRRDRCVGLHDHGFVYTGLRDSLQRQYDGSWLKAYPGMAEYNEVLVSSQTWSHNLPWVRSHRRDSQSLSSHASSHPRPLPISLSGDRSLLLWALRGRQVRAGERF